MEKIPCDECGALILPATAEETGGVCMACKRGIRQNIEASKEFYRKQKEYDPFRALWLSLVARVHDGADGFEGLSEDEKIYFAVGVLDGEAYNGGMHQFFFNSAGEFYQQARHGLAMLGAEDSLALLDRATRILFGADVPARDRGERWAQMPQDLDGPAAAELERIDDDFCHNPDNLSDRLSDFAERSGLIAPFRAADGSTDGTPD